MCECRHGKGKHHHGWAYGLECYYCEICGCPEYSEESAEEGHKHLCLLCDAVLEEGIFDCEIDADHDYGLCAECYANENGQFGVGA